MALSTALATALAACGDGVSPPPVPTIGIYSETDPKFAPDREIFVGSYAGSAATSSIVVVSDHGEFREGVESLRATVRVSGVGFAGWFVSWGDASKTSDDMFTHDMSGYSSGSIIFWVRSPIRLEMGIRSGNVPPGLETSKIILGLSHNFAADSTWRRACVLVSDLVGTTRKADLSRIKVLFNIDSNQGTGGTGGIDRTFWIDDVRWQTKPCA